MSEPQSPVFLVYDGDCPFCSAVARMARIKKAVGELRILNARDATGPVMDEIHARGFDLNQGIVVKLGEQFYHGEDALHMLAMIGSRSGLFNRINVALFRNRRTVTVMYPIMKAFRGLSLKALGRRPI